MELLTLSLSVVALLVALVAIARASSQAARIEDNGRDARRRNENLAEELSQGLDNLRRLTAELAQGHELTREMVLEGRLWRDMNSAEGGPRLASGELRVLDVRNPQETQAGVIPGAQLIPLDQLEARLDELSRDAGPLLICCAGGGRSAAACEFLAGQGFQGLYNLTGGMSAWPGPVERSAG